MGEVWTGTCPHSSMSGMVRTVAEEQALLVGTGAWLRAGQGSALHIQPWAL